MRKKLKKTSIVTLVIMLFVQLFIVNINTKASVVDSYLTLNRTAVNTKGESGTSLNVRVGEKIDIGYSVGSTDIPSASVNQQQKPKKIIMIVDTSGSMSTKDMTNQSGSKISRLQATVQSAEKFINSFVDKTNASKTVADIGVIKFSDEATMVSNFTSSKTSLINAVDSLGYSGDGGTNVGDGLRVAYNMFQALQNPDDYQKYVILLTDGVPTVWSYTGNDTSNYYYGTDIPDNNTSNRNYKVKWIDNNDSTGKALEYSKKMAQRIPNANISSFMVGFTADIDISKLTQITNSSKGQLSTARSSNGLDSVYSALATQILDEVVIDNVSFTEAYPSNVEIVSAPDGFTISGQNVTGKINNIRYTVINKGLSNEAYRLVEPVNFTVSIKYKDGSTGTNVLSGGVSNLSYRDFKGQTGSKTFNNLTFNVQSNVTKISQIPVSMTRSLSTNTYTLNNGITDDININYTINPSDIDFYSIVPDDYFKERYVVVVADTSGSMSQTINGKTRLDTLKNTLNSTNNDGFINKLEGNPKVNVALVDYDSVAKLGNELSTDDSSLIKNSQGLIQDFADLSDSSQTRALKNQIANMKADGGTNLGDGLRRAYWLLDKVNSNALKYIVVMTDGFPTAFSYNSLTLFGPDYKFDDGAADDYYVNSGDSDWFNYSLSYGDQVAKMIAAKSINSYVIGFSDGINSSKLTEINTNIGGTYKEAKSPSDLSDIYNNIAGQISSDLPIGKLDFSAVLPAGVQFKNITNSSGVVIDGFTATKNSDGTQTVSGPLEKIGGISYKLNSDKTYFVASPISFNLVANGRSAGTFNIAKNSTFIKFQDLNTTTRTLYSTNDISFTIQSNPSLVLKHGLLVDNSSSDISQNFRESSGTADPINVVNYTRYNAAVLVQSTSSNTNVSVSIDRRDPLQIKDTKDIVIKVFAVNTDNTYNKTSEVTNVIKSTPTLVNGTASFSVTLPQTGKYLITYSFYMKAPDSITDFVNKATIDSVETILKMKLNALPEMY